VLKILLTIALALTAGALFVLARLILQERRPGLFVLLYHRLRSTEEWSKLNGAERNFSVPVERFEAQLVRLAEAGFRFVGLEPVVRATGGEPLESPAIHVTFDDGCESVGSLAAPILAQQDIPATVFVTADPGAWIFEEQPRLSDTALRALSDAGWTVGSHGVSHHALCELLPAALNAELRESRATLERIVGGPVSDLAIPLNYYNERVLKAAQDAGYRLVFTSDPGPVRPGDPAGRLRRMTAEGGMSPDQLLRSLSSRARVERRIVQALKRVPARLLGEQRWMPVRRRIFASKLGPWLNFRGLRTALLVGVLGWLLVLSALIGAAL